MPVCFTPACPFYPFRLHAVIGRTLLTDCALSLRMPIVDADYWMVRRDSERCILLYHERGIIVANRVEDAPVDGETWDLLVRLDGDEIHDETHDVPEKAALWELIEDLGERFEEKGH